MRPTIIRLRKLLLTDKVSHRHSFLSRQVWSKSLRLTYCNIAGLPVLNLSQTSFSLYLHNQWTDFHKLSCTGKPQMRAICICVGCTKATTND